MLLRFAFLVRWRERESGSSMFLTREELCAVRYIFRRVGRIVS